MKRHCLFFLPESRRESAEWKFPHEPSSKILRAGTNYRKVTMLTVYWDVKGIMKLEVTESRRIDSFYASVMNEARKKRRKPRNADLWLLQDNTPIHNSELSVDEVSKSGLKVLSHPPYSSDLAPSDFFLFQHLKKHLRGQHFSSKSDVEQAVREFFESQPPSFYEMAFQQLLMRWEKCIEVNGSYIEK
mgnify:CR=1 FL=1